MKFGNKFLVYHQIVFLILIAKLKIKVKQIELEQQMNLTNLQILKE